MTAGRTSSDLHPGGLDDVRHYHLLKSSLRSLAPRAGDYAGTTSRLKSRSRITLVPLSPFELEAIIVRPACVAYDRPWIGRLEYHGRRPVLTSIHIHARLPTDQLSELREKEVRHLGATAGAIRDENPGQKETTPVIFYKNFIFPLSVCRKCNKNMIY